MIRGNYLVRSFKGKKYYLNLLDSNDISRTPPSYYGNEISLTLQDRKINYFILHITDACNMKCKYCFEQDIKNSRSLKMTDIRDLIKFINNNEKVAKEITIRFFGGEPLLRTEFISESIPLIENSITNKRVKYNIFTNGTILNDEIFKLLDKYPIILFISIDGNEISHNRNRLMANGNHSHDLISKNIKTLTSRYNNRIITRSVIDPLGTQEFIENIDYILSLGVRQLSFTLPWGGYNDKQIMIKSYKSNLFDIIDRYFAEFLEKIKKHQFDRIGVHPFSSTLFSIIGEKENLLDSRACGAGYEVIAIGTNGKIYPCHSFVYKNEYEIGDLKDSSIDLSNKIGNMTGDTIKKCSLCDIKYLCKVRCPADNLMSNGSVDSVTPIKCEVEKYIIDSICNLVLELKSLPKERRLMRIIEEKHQLKGYA